MVNYLTMSQGMDHIKFIGVSALNEMYQTIYKSKLIIRIMKSPTPRIIQGWVSQHYTNSCILTRMVCCFHNRLFMNVPQVFNDVISKTSCDTMCESIPLQNTLVSYLKFIEIYFRTKVAMIHE